MLIGFNQTKSTLLTNFHSQKLHHALIINGKKGMGKSSFAKEFVLEILQSKNTNHPDLLLIEKDEGKKEITVDKVRKIHEFVTQTSAIGNNKFIIIDSACELNKSASNAILKILEEPNQNNFLILIAHNLNKILPTIRSRCQIIEAPNFNFADFSQILQRQNISDNLNFLAEICDNSPAEAINNSKDLSKVYQLFLNSFAQNKLDENLLKIISDKNFSFTIFIKVLEFFSNRFLQFLNGVENNFYFNEQEIFLLLSKKVSAENFLRISEESLTMAYKVLPFYLDKKLCVINIFNRI